jgi:hypothetical protein
MFQPTQTAVFKTTMKYLVVEHVTPVLSHTVLSDTYASSLFFDYLIQKKEKEKEKENAQLVKAI